jgi:hypothetical protein
VPAFGSAPVDLRAQLAIGIELVDPEHRDFGVVGMARRFRRMGSHRPKALAIGDKVGDRQVLVAHDHHIPVEPCLIDRVPGGLVHRLDVDAGDLDADLRSQLAYLEHPRSPPRDLRASEHPVRRACNGAFRAADPRQGHIIGTPRLVRRFTSA